MLVPRTRSLGALESRLGPGTLAAWTLKTRNEEVNVAMPRFKMSGGFMLTATLHALGLKDAFDEALADFSGMDGRLHWLYLSAVLHRAFIEVNDRPGSGHVVQEFAPFFLESVAGHDGGTVLVAAHDQTTAPDQRFGCFSSSLVRVTNSLAAASASNCPWMVARFFTASSAFGT